MPGLGKKAKKPTQQRYKVAHPGNTPRRRNKHWIGKGKSGE
ncbi:MAG TPA: hypothetical protein VNX68_08495 [Nitrosopumilaceae archaeon]|jgi:hypothetical protein|nr:hypothetical protein [Nitrosopumilaceae archaeon]